MGKHDKPEGILAKLLARKAAKGAQTGRHHSFDAGTAKDSGHKPKHSKND